MDAYEKGVNAFNRGVSLEDNPYRLNISKSQFVADHIDAVQWEAGWKSHLETQRGRSTGFVRHDDEALKAYKQD